MDERSTGSCWNKWAACSCAPSSRSTRRPGNDVNRSPRGEKTNMTVNAAALVKKSCQPCEGGIPPLPATELPQYLTAVPAWRLTDDGRRIRREWRVKDFVTALD